MVNQFQLTFTIKNNINKTGVSVQVTTQAKCVCPNSCYSFWYFYTNKIWLSNIIFIGSAVYQSAIKCTVTDFCNGICCTIIYNCFRNYSLRLYFHRPHNGDSGTAQFLISQTLIIKFIFSKNGNICRKYRDCRQGQHGDHHADRNQ